MKYLIPISALALIMASCSGGSEEKKEVQTIAPSMTPEDEAALHKNASAMFGVLPYEAENAENPSSPEKIALGKKLYFDTQLSREGNQSCNTCHDLSTFGVDNKVLSEGDDGSMGERNSPTVFNTALHFRQFWDGRAADVEEQAGGPILNPIEMGMPDEASVEARLNNDPEYPALFAAAFPDESAPLTFENISRAIASFERQLITPGRFDDYIDGDMNALTFEEKQGLKTFMESGCTTCHNGAVVGGNMYQKFALFGNYWEYTGSEVIDEGRFKETGVESDKYMFKSPSLRNVAMTSPYLHDGSVENLEEVTRIMAKSQLNRELTDTQAKEIVTFLNALTQDIAEEYKTL